MPLQNPTVKIKRLADFLGLEVTEELVQEITNKCSFKNLKTADATFKDTTVVKKADHYRKGNQRILQSQNKSWRTDPVGHASP